MLFLFLTIFAAIAIAAPPVAKIAASGKAQQPIVIADKASDRTRAAAQTLADYLTKISGGKFEVSTGDGSQGIAVGQSGDFPNLQLGQLWDTADVTRSEDYLLRSHAAGLYLLGASDLAVEHAVWDLLYRLGHRQFFPSDAWEVVPESQELAIAVDDHEHPDYYARRIWYGFGPWDYAEKPYAAWCARNRATSGIALNSGHAYDGILARNKARFAEHPEYLGLWKGERKTTKFCISNSGLRQLVVDDALAQVEKNPTLQSVSVDPSDGGGWCQCDECQKLGSITDRALTLANAVAAGLDAKHGPTRFVGMYAYNEHSPPPSIAAHPRVVVSVATSFIQGGFTIDELLAGWQKKCQILGIREYYSVVTWDHDLPGSARGARLDYLQRTIPHFHQLGARFLSSESSDNWGPNGLGYYLAARMLWDVKEADRQDELIADFLDRSFGPAREPMAAYYQMLDGSQRVLLSDDLLGRMFRQLREAHTKTNDPAIGRRIDDLTLYTRYVELFRDYSAASGPARQAAYEALIRHAYRMRTTMLIHTKGLYRDIINRDKSLSIPPDAIWSVPEKKNPWKSSEPFTRDELAGMLSDGIERHPLVDFTPVSFSDELVPAGKLNLPQVKPGSLGNYSRGLRKYFTWIDKPGTLHLKVRAGNVYQSRGPAKLALYPVAEVEGKAVAEAEVAPDRADHEVALSTTHSGLHRLEVNDSAAGTWIDFPAGQTCTLASTPESPPGMHGRWSLYFYVPPGAKTIGGYAAGEGALHDPAGKLAHTFPQQPGYFSVPVPAGSDGQLWQFRQSIGDRLLMTVPPYLARSGAELLLPAEVVK